MTADITKIKIDYDLQGKDPREVEKLIQKAVDEVVKGAHLAPDAVKIFPPRKQTRWEITLEIAPDSPPCPNPLIITVCGVRGDDDPDTLAEPIGGGRPFQPGQKYAFEISVDKNIGDIFKLRLGFAKSVTQAALKVKWLQLLHPRNKDVFNTACNLIIKKSPTEDPWQEVFVVWPDYPLLPQIQYHVYVHTSPKSGAMDCGADIFIHGDYGDSGRRSLKNAKSPRFQSGQVDQFIVPIIKLGEVRKVRIINDLSGSKTNWMIEKVVVKERPDSDQQWEFLCGRYFDPNAGDKKYDRVLQPGQEPEDPEPPKPLEPLPDDEPLDMPPEPEEEPKPKKEKKEKEVEEVKEVKEKKNIWMLWWENRGNQAPQQSVPLSFVIVGENSASDPIELEMDLKPGESDKRKIRFDPDKTGPIDKVRFNFGANAKKGIKWEIAKLHLKDLDTDEVHTFEFQKPVIKKETGDSTVEASPKEKGIPISIYQVELHTADRTALFEDDVRAKLLVRGERGDTGQRMAVNAPVDGKLKIKHGDVLKFDIEGVDIGEIKGVVFTHNKAGKKTADFVQKIVVRPTHQKNAEYIITFTMEARPLSVEENLWHIWWENRDEQKEHRHDVELAFVVIGDRGPSDELVVKAPLKPGESDKIPVRIDAHKIGQIDKVRFKFTENSKKGIKWEIAKLHLQKVYTGELHTFEFQRPVVKTAGDSTVEASGKGIPISIYEVELHTADRDGLFDNDVKAKILIRGKNGDTGERTAVDAVVDGKLSIKRGEVLKFEIEGVDVGEIKGVVFTHNKIGKKTAEFVQKIVVRPSHNKSAEYSVTFDLDTKRPLSVEDTIWQIWWENRDDQKVFEDVELTVAVVGAKDVTEDFPIKTSLKPEESEKRHIKFDGSKIGAIDKVRLRFADAVKYKTKWRIAKFHLFHVRTEQKHTFEFPKSVVKKEGADSTVEASARGIPLTIHEVELYVGDRKALFDKDVYAKVIIRGVKGDTGKRTAFNAEERRVLKESPLKPNDVIRCEVEGVDIGDVKSVQFIHNKPSLSPGDFVQKIVVRPLHRPGIEYVFEYEKRGPPPQGGPTIKVEKQAPMASADPREWVMSWTNYGNQPKDALEISIILFGEKGETPTNYLDIELGPGESKQYKLMVEEDIGELTRLRFGHGPKTTGEHPWKVQEVRMKHIASGLLHRFIMGPPPKPPSAAPRYRVEVQMRRSASNIGATAEIYIRMKGEKLTTDKCWLVKSLTNPVRFLPGKTDVFELENVPEVGDVQNITFGGPDERVVAALRTYVIKVIIVPMHWREKKEFVFNFNNESAVPQMAPVNKRTWIVKIKTGNLPISTTQAPLSMALCGRRKNSEVVTFKQANGFVPNQVYQFKVDFEDVDDAFKIRLGFEDWSKRPTLFIEDVVIEALNNGPQYAAAAREWVWASAKQDGWREFPLKKAKLQLKPCKYQLVVWTGKKRADEGVVYVEIFGSTGDTGKRRLANSKSHVTKFEKYQMDLFDIDALDIGDVRKLNLTFVPKDTSTKWQVQRMLLQMNPLGGEEFVFDCRDTYLDSSNDFKASFPVTVRNPGKPIDPPSPEDYLVYVTTGPDDKMSTMATVSLTVFGDRGAAPPSSLLKAGPVVAITASGKPKLSTQNFQSGSVDSFILSIPSDHIGTITKTRIEHNNIGSRRNWFLNKFTLQNLSRPRESTLHFDVDQWLSATEADDGEVVRECPAHYFGQPVTIAHRYEVTINLGPATSAEIPSNVTVHIVLCGKSPYNTGKRGLRKTINGTPFLAPNSASTFRISAVGVGEITRLVMGHDSTDMEFQLEITTISVKWDAPNVGSAEFVVNKALVRTKPSQNAELTITN